MRILRDAYFFQVVRVWSHLPDSVRVLRPGRMCGRYLHALVRRRSDRQQYFATFFLRNRAELELMCRLVKRRVHGSNLDLLVMACSKGAEVYSILWKVRSARPDLRVSTNAVDISPEIVEFAQQGIYSRKDLISSDIASPRSDRDRGDVTWNTSRDQNAPIFERVTEDEMKAMFEIEGDTARVKPWLKEGITWRSGDARDPGLANIVGQHDLVVANRFICHMAPRAAEECLRNVVRLVRPGGYLFVSGIDLDVRTRVAQELGWVPVMDLMKEIHEGDGSLRSGWPLEYWGLEPFGEDQPDWKIRYASVFQIGEPGNDVKK